MIQYALKCDQGHCFDSWFQSADAYDALAGSGHLSCAVCGSTQVAKSLMTPKVRLKPASGALAEAEAEGAEPAALSEQEMIAALRKKVEAESEYVGNRFAAEARSMHDGDVPERPIYGQANFEEAKALVEDGVPVLPLPFKPKQKLQ